MTTVTAGRRKPGRMLRDVLLVARGTVLGQAPFVIASPLMTRLYTPTELGVFGLAMAFIGIVAPMAGLRYELAAITVRDQEDGRRLLALSALALIPVTVVASIVLSALKVSGVGSYDALSWPLVALAAATIAAAGLYSTLRCWLVRGLKFQLVSRSLALQGTLRGLIPLLLAPLSLGALLLTGAELVARCFSIAALALRGKLLHSLRQWRLSMPALRATARRFWKYPLLMAPSALVDATALAIPVPIVASCYDLTAAGQFALAQRLVLLPAALIASSVGDVFHAHAADAMQTQPTAARELLVSAGKRLLLLAIIVYAPIAILAPLTAGWVFGHHWSAVGMLIAALAPMSAAQTVVSPLSRGLLLNNKEERKLVADVVCLVVPAATLYLARNLPLFQAVGLFSIAAAGAFVVYFVVILSALQQERRTPGS